MNPAIAPSSIPTRTARTKDPATLYGPTGYYQRGGNPGMYASQPVRVLARNIAPTILLRHLYRPQRATRRLPMNATI